jgi:hypothetical protein
MNDDVQAIARSTLGESRLGRATKPIDSLTIFSFLSKRITRSCIEHIEAGRTKTPRQTQKSTRQEISMLHVFGGVGKTARAAIPRYEF